MDQDDPTPDDFDTPWKTALTRYLPEFMAFYFPEAYAAIDWQKPHRFLDQELAQVVRDAGLGKRLVDRLVEVATVASGLQWVYIHIEVQGQRDKAFAERLFTYNYRLYDRYHRPVATLAVLADEQARWRPVHFGYDLFGCRHYLEFPVVKLLDYREKLEGLLADPNPFALVTAAHLLTQQTRRDPEARYAAKWRLARLLYERGWDKQRVIDLYMVIDWLLHLPDLLERRLWTLITALEREKKMPYVSSAERFGIEKGLQKGIKKGLAHGARMGRQEGEAALLYRQLTRRFGPLPDWVEDRLRRASIEELETWGDRVLDATKLADVFEHRDA